MPTPRSAARKRAKQTKPRSGLPTYPRPDLSPPELVIGSLADLGRVILASDELDEEDREAVERAVGQLNELELYPFIERQRRVPATLKRQLVEKIGTIAGAAYLIGAHGAMTETSRVFFQQSQATVARQRRKVSPEEQRLREAIETEMKAAGRTIPPEHPYKEAGSILEDVNKRLGNPIVPGKRPAVSVDVIAYRLGARRRKS